MNSTTTTTGIIPACEYCNGCPAKDWTTQANHPTCQACLDAIEQDREAQAYGWTDDEMADMDGYLARTVCLHCGTEPDFSDPAWDHDDGPACVHCGNRGLCSREAYETGPSIRQGDGPGGVTILPGDYRQSGDHVRWADGTVTGDFDLDMSDGEEIPF